MSGFNSCPRCGARSFERLQTYSHCCQCLYVEDYWRDVEADYTEALRVFNEINDSSDEQNEIEDCPNIFGKENESTDDLNKLKGA